MGIRVNSNLISNMLAGVALDRQQENQAITELSTGRKVNMPSDDPSAAAALVLNNSQMAAVNSYLSNVTSLTSTLQVADSTLNSVVTGLSKAISRAVQGANGTLLSQSDRDAIAEEVDGIKAEILGYANTAYQGKYLFAGTAVSTQPFVADTSSSSGVSYVGNTGVNNVEIGEGQTVPANLAGSQIFTVSGSDVFQALSDLSTALKSGSSTDVQTAETEVQSAFDYVNKERTFYGTMISRLDTASSFLNEESVQLSEEQNTLVGADTATAATQVTQAEVALEATLAAGGKISQLSLLDYLQ